ncbi:MAG: 16S rRNA (guanine(527)-N(7))-methyltransferase RsmG [Nocardioidaceae bacterium]
MAASVGGPDPGLVKALFPSKYSTIYRYVDLLATEAVERGLLGPQEASRLWGRHIFNCAVIRDLFTESSSLCDVGSGAGLPGVVLALARPDLAVVLLEPLLRRAAFLHEVVGLLSLRNVEVVRARAEDQVGQCAFDYVTARAVAPLERLARWALPLCRAGGELVAIKGSTAAAELNQSAAVVAALGGRRARIEEYGVGVVSPLTTVIRIESGEPQGLRGKGMS